MEGSQSAYNPKDQQNLLYLYDLPKSVSSTQIAKLIKEKTDVDLDIAPQIKRDFGRHFYTAMIKINDNEKFKRVVEAMKYPLFDGKPCRGLPFDKDFLGGNRVKTIEKNVFVKNIPKEWTPEQLDEEFRKYGEIKSCKISLNENHESNGYGFVCFKDVQSAKVAVESTKDNEQAHAEPYHPKDKRDFQKVFNNVYIKNFPVEWDENNLAELFAPYGKVSSKAIVKNQSGAFGFVCFDNIQEGGATAQQCANRAVSELHGKQLDATHVLYCKPALSKSEREAEKQKEMLRYKNSKKRCNLYVKNFPPNTTKEQLQELFGAYGQIESVKLSFKEGEALYAFVCFKSPEEATRAKAELHQKSFNGKQLYINHYEIKEIRKAQYEEIHDKTDFQNYKKSNTNVQDLLHGKPEILALLTQFITLIQPRLISQLKSGPMKMNRNFNQGGPRGGMQKQFHSAPVGGHPNQMANNQQIAYPQQQMQAYQQQQPMMRQQPNLMMPPMPVVGMQPILPPQYQQNAGYLQKAIPLIPAVSVQNPNYKMQVGEVIYEFVEKISGEDRAPKITGMLIDLPLDEIVGYLKDYNKLEEKVIEASNLLASQGQ